MEARDLRRLALPEYLELDRSSDLRWEYVDGEAFAMAGASPEHNLVKDNVLVALRVALAGSPCIPFGDGQKIATRRTRAYHYPDGLVVCGPLDRDPDDANALTSPTLLVEVLSPSTADYERGGKLVHYRNLPSLQEVLLVSLEPRVVERHRRLESGDWLLREIRAGDVELASLGVTLPWEAIFRDLERVTGG